MVRFEGREEKRKDWMTTLTEFTTEDIERSPLSNLLETAIQADGAVLFQVVFEPRSDWSPKAKRQKGLLKQGVHSQAGLFFRTLIDGALGVSDEEKQERHRGDTPQDIGGSIHDSQVGGQRSGTSRMGQIDLKNPSHTYNTSMRVACSDEVTAETIQDSLNHLSGQFYSISGKDLGQNEFEYKRMLNHGLTYPNGWESIRRRKPMLVTNVEELANFITVPSINALPKASRGGSGGRPAAQSPLTSPNEKVFNEFSDGMTIGRAVTALREDDEEDGGISAIESKNEWWQQLEQRDAISLSAGDLTHHYIRGATTGSGKTVATLNDMLTTNEFLDGPTILIDPKGGDMCENYLRCHRALFGDVDDVEYIKIPEKDGKIPGIPFFDLRPLVEGGNRERATAKQDIIDHYFQVLRFVLGRETVEQAFVANEILTNLIKANFDEEYGSDHFSIGKLMRTAQAYQKYGKQYDPKSDEDQSDIIAQAVPKTSDPQVRDILMSHLQKDERQFTNTTDAVLNRIRKLKERDFIWDMLSYEVSDENWDEENNWYDKNEVSMLDMKSILNSNKVVLIDTGNLRGESSEVFTVLFLSHLWTSVQSIWTPDRDDYIANVIIEESANIARNEIVYRELLPKGREFNLSLGLIMQYPEQVLGEDPRANKRAYKEILNNINTKIIGNVATDDLLADSLFHEDLDGDQIKDRINGLKRGEWVVQLPSTGFDEQKPEILTLKPLPIPPGHSEGPFSIRSKSEEVRKRSRQTHCVGRDDPQIDIIGSDQPDAPGTDTAADTSDDDTDDDVDDLGFRHRSFLDAVIDALTDGLENYNLGSPMSDLRYSDKADDLVEWGMLEKEKLGNNELYYKPTTRGLSLMKREFAPESGGEKGDESLIHRIGVRITATYYEQQGYDVEMYHSPEDKSAVYDVYAEPTEESPDDNNKIVEVETSPEKRGHVEDDYRTLAAARGDAVWVVENLGGAEDLIRSLDGYISSDMPTSSGNFQKLSDALDEHGANKLLSINNLRDEV
jgi:hypothetical protein